MNLYTYIMKQHGIKGWNQLNMTPDIELHFVTNIYHLQESEREEQREDTEDTK